ATRPADAHQHPRPARSRVLGAETPDHAPARAGNPEFPGSMNLALFDLDNTLLACDSDYEWGQFLVDRGVLEREAYEAQNAEFHEQSKPGTLDIHEFLGFALRPLAEHSPEDLERWHAEFMATRIRPAIGEKSRALVRKHKEAGDLCAVITATNSFVTAPIAR